jgi:hypothetical protein
MSSCQFSLLTRADFLGSAAQLRRFDAKALPWDAKRGVRVQNLTAGEHAEFEIKALSMKKGGLVKEKLVEAKRVLVAMTVVDANGNCCMTEDDVKAMEKTDGRLVAFAYAFACEHCGITESEVEDLVKNSAKIDGDSSACDSP